MYKTSEKQKNWGGGGEGAVYLFSINFQVTIDFPAFSLVKIHCL